MQVLSYKFRLYPNRAQVAGLEAMLGSFCDLYNACLQQRIEAYRRAGKTLRYVDQAGELKAVRAVDERLAGYSYSAEQQVLRRLDKAFSAFFRRLKAKGKAGFPRFRVKSRFDSAEFRVGDGLTIRKSKRLGVVGIPGEIKVKWHCQSASNFQPASACNFQPRLRLQNLLSRESTGGSRARRGVPSWLTQRRAWEGPVGPPGQRTGGRLWIRSGS